MTEATSAAGDAGIRAGRYRHVKGAVYVVTGLARHSETEEWLVVYHRDGSDELWVRPAAMWSEVVERGGVTAPRFAPLDDDAAADAD